jgi:hypothetical protein
MAIIVCLTLPQKILEKIDKERGDINRSRYVLRLLEKAYKNEQIRNSEEN